MRAELRAALLAVSLMLGANDAEAWPSCAARDDAPCGVIYLNVITRAGNAILFVDNSCRGEWTHLWRVDDAHAEIRQFLDAAWERGQGSLCIPIPSEVDEIRITPVSSHCSFEGIATGPSGAGGMLRRGVARSIALTGCHARAGDLRFGGIALLFADGYGFGDSYAAGFFYGAYDGFGERVVAGTEDSVFRLSDFNTNRYGVEILANGSPSWSIPRQGDDRP